MTDIPESDLIRLLAPLIEKTRLTNSSDPSRMDTEDATADNLPSLQSVLARVLKYPVSPAALGKAIHAQFTDYRDLVCLFEILDGWMSQWVSKGSMVKFEVEVRDVKSIAAFDQTKKAEKKLGIPTLDYVSDFRFAFIATIFLYENDRSSSLFAYYSMPPWYPSCSMQRCNLYWRG
jgi:hypothetical protein